MSDSGKKRTTDRVQQIASTIARLKPEEKDRLFRLLAERQALPAGVRFPPAPVPSSEARSSKGAKKQAPDYLLIFDGGSKGNPGWGYGSYLIRRVQDGAERLQRIEFGDGYTNNEAEYDTLIAALRDLIQRIEAAHRSPGEFSIEIRGDSELVIKQLLGQWKAREPRMRDRRDQGLHLLRQFGAFTLISHPRQESVDVLGH